MFNAKKYLKIEALDRILASDDTPDIPEDSSYISEPWYTYDMQTAEITLCSNGSVQRWPIPESLPGVVYSNSFLYTSKYRFYDRENV